MQFDFNPCVPLYIVDGLRLGKFAQMHESFSGLVLTQCYMLYGRYYTSVHGLGIYSPGFLFTSVYCHTGKAKGSWIDRVSVSIKWAGANQLTERLAHDSGRMSRQRPSSELACLANLYSLLSLSLTLYMYVYQSEGPGSEGRLQPHGVVSSY